MFLKFSLSFFALLSTLSFTQNAKADFDDFVCPEEFLCPEAIMPEVKKWIHILGEQDETKALIYDIDTHHIYGSVDCGENCNNSTLPIAEVERIKSKLSVSDTTRVKYKIGMNERFYKGIAIYQTYKNYIRQSLIKNKLPLALQYLPFYESGYSPIAKSNSKKIARGVWQLEPPAAKGLLMTTTMDERQDVVKATDKAMDYFNASYKCIRDEANKYEPGVCNITISPFVVTSYIYGTRIKNAFAEFGLDYPKIQDEYQGPEFKDYSRKYYPQFLAVTYIGEHMDRFFEEVPEGYRDFSTQTLKFSKPTRLLPFADNLSLKFDELLYLNQNLIHEVWVGTKSIPTSYKFQVPLLEDDGAVKKYAKIVGTYTPKREVVTIEPLKPRPVKLEITAPQKDIVLPKTSPIPLSAPEQKSKLNALLKNLFK